MLRIGGYGGPTAALHSDAACSAGGRGHTGSGQFGDALAPARARVALLQTFFTFVDSPSRATTSVGGAAASSMEWVNQATLGQPVAPEHPTVLEAHGDKRVDSYYWLREKQNPEVIAYLEAENAYTDAVMAPTADRQEKLYSEVAARIPEPDTPAP